MNKLVLPLREAALTERCPTTPHHGSYSVGLHSHQMLTLLWALAPEELKRSTRLLWAITFHDTPERWVGDTPSTSKWGFRPALGKLLDETEGEITDALALRFNLNPVEESWLRALDLLEYYLWTEDQLAMGNQLVWRSSLRAKVLLVTRGDVPQPVAGFARGFVWQRTAMFGEEK